MASTKLGTLRATVALCALLAVNNANKDTYSCYVAPLAPHADMATCVKKRSVEIPGKYTTIIKDISQKYDVDVDLIAAVIKQESKWRPYARNYKSQCKGLMQLKDETAAEMAKKIGLKQYNIFDAATNIELGTAYLAWLKSREHVNTVPDILASYNWGYGNFVKKVAKRGLTTDMAIAQKIAPKETRDYVQNITLSMGLD